MSITVNCPNGHVLKVKNELAGKSGLCPYCRARVDVAMPARTPKKPPITDDDILGLLGPPYKVAPEPPPEDDSVLHDPHHDASHGDAESGISLLGSSILRQHKVCPKCGILSPVVFSHCSRCGADLPQVGKS